MADAPGYSMSADDLARLPFEVEPASTPGVSAKWLADRYLEQHQERPQDARLRTGSIEQHHRSAVVELLVAAGYRGDVGAAARSVPMDADVALMVSRLVEDQQASAPAPRSSDAIVAGYRARR